MLAKLLFHAQILRQNRFAQPECAGRYLQQFIILDKLHALLEAHCRRRDEAQRVIRAGGTGVGHLLFFADVTDDIFVFSAFAHDHALIYRHTRADEQPAALLCVKQAVSRGFPRLMHDDRAALAGLNFALIGS